MSQLLFGSHTEGSRGYFFFIPCVVPFDCVFDNELEMEGRFGRAIDQLQTEPDLFVIIEILCQLPMFGLQERKV